MSDMTMIIDTHKFQHSSSYFVGGNLRYVLEDVLVCENNNHYPR